MFLFRGRELERTVGFEPLQYRQSALSNIAAPPERPSPQLNLAGRIFTDRNRSTAPFYPQPRTIKSFAFLRRPARPRSLRAHYFRQNSKLNAGRYAQPRFGHPRLT